MWESSHAQAQIVDNVRLDIHGNKSWSITDRHTWAIPWKYPNWNTNVLSHNKIHSSLIFSTNAASIRRFDYFKVASISPNSDGISASHHQKTGSKQLLENHHGNLQNYSASGFILLPFTFAVRVKNSSGVFWIWLLPAKESHLHVPPEENISDGGQFGGTALHLQALLLYSHHVILLQGCWHPIKTRDNCETTKHLKSC